ncbi:hypothetical protein LCGC14_2069010 [marine sediment metagenome]|uniref:Uncharacterized protein n=1 Tax=marine sediment metagenome TaxID=412755 RepID=A0A0F9HG03_9ZZZZ
MQPQFNSDNEMFTEVNTLCTAVKAAANLTAGEKAELTRIDARTQWRPRDVNSFLRILGETIRRKTGASD